MSTLTVTQQAEAKPAAKSTRIEGYDVARALAILGMIIVNFKLVMGSSENGPDWLVFLVSLLEGRAAALFVVLAGVSLTLLSRRALNSDDAALRRTARQRILKRAVFLFVFGFLLVPIWPADILHFYSLYMTLGALLLFVPDRRLMWSAATVIGIGFLLLITLDYEAGWDWDTLTITDFWTVPGLVRHMLFNGFHPVFPWAAFLIFGMWVGRQDILDRAYRHRLLQVALIVLVAAEVTSAGLIAVTAPELGQDNAIGLFGRNPMPPSPFYIVAASSTALIVILLLVEISERTSGQFWWRILTTTGQFALTLYVAHILFGMGIMEMLGWIDSGESLVLALVYAIGFYGAGIAFALFWRGYFTRGPFEALMRRLTD